MRKIPPNSTDVKDIKSIKDLESDPHNTNRGTARGRSMLETSVQRNGIGRSVLADKHGRLIAGNTATETIADVMGTETEVIVIKTDGTKLIVHQRTDLDLETDPRARELAMLDNRVAEVGLDWDAEALAASGVDLTGYWSQDELAELMATADDATPDHVRTVEIERPAEVAWVLLEIPLDQWPQHQAAVEAMQNIAKFSTMVVRPRKVDPDAGR